MNAAQARRVSEAEYLASEATSETKHEYVNGEMIAMAGVSLEHSLVQMGLGAAIQGALAAAGKRCLTLSPDMRVRIDETGLYAYPDLTVVCAKPQLDRSANPPSLLNPLVIFEVLSDSTEAYDRGAKAAHYRSRASLQEYVLVSSTERRVELLRRGEEGWWRSALFEGDASIPLASLGIEVPLSAIYRQLDLL